MLRKLYDWYNALPGNITNLVFFVLGIGFTILFFVVTQDRKEISVFQSIAPAVVFDSTTVSPKLSVIDDAGRPITESVYIDTITIWNSGNLPIDKADIRVPVRFTISPISRLIDSTILRANYLEESGFELETIQNSTSVSDTAIVQLNWVHFDQEFGATIQFTYAATDPAEIATDGHIQGIWPRSFKIENPKNSSWNEFILVAITAMVFMILANTVAKYMIPTRVQTLLSAPFPRLLITLLVTTLLMIVGFLFFYFALWQYREIQFSLPAGL